MHMLRDAEISEYVLKFSLRNLEINYGGIS